MSKLSRRIAADAKKTRLENARDLGYDTDTTYYKGSRGGQEEFRPNNFTGMIHATTEPDIARDFAGGALDDIYELYAKPGKSWDWNNPGDVAALVSSLDRDAILKEMADPNIAGLGEYIKMNGADVAYEDFLNGLSEGAYQSLELPSVAKAVQRLGYDSIKMREDLQSQGHNLAVFEPNRLRSTEAQFDPARRNSGNLMAGTAAAAVGLGALASPEEAEAGVIKRNGKTLIESYHGTPHRFPAERKVKTPEGVEEYLVGDIDQLPDVPEGYLVEKDYPLGRIRNDKIGTGEGAQAFGYGAYSADRRGTAEYYKNMRNDDGKTDFTDVIDDNVLEYHAQEGGFETPEEAKSYLRNDLIIDLIREENPDIPDYVLENMADEITNEIGDDFYKAAAEAEKVYMDLEGADVDAMNKALDQMSTKFEDAREYLDLTDRQWLTTGDGYFDATPGAKTFGDMSIQYPKESELSAYLTDYTRGYRTIDDAIEEFSDPENFNYNPEMADLAKSWKDQGVEIGRYEGGGNSTPSMYKLEIDADPDTMLHWDQKFEDQPPYVQEQLKAAGISPSNADPNKVVSKAMKEANKLLGTMDANLKRNAPPWFKQIVGRVRSDVDELSKAPDKDARDYAMRKLTGNLDELQHNLQEGFMKDDTAFKSAAFNLGVWQDNVTSQLGSGNLTGQDIYKQLERDLGQQGASDKMKELGIPGLQYYDGASRNRKKNSHNYVMFDDSKIDIKERGAIDPRLATGLAAGSTGILGAGMLAGPEIKDTLQGEAMAGALDTVWGGLQNAGKFAWDAGTNFGAALTGRENLAPTIDDYQPMTDTGRAVEGLIGSAVGGLMDYKPPLRDVTLGEELGGAMNWYTDTARPWLQENVGQYGTRLGEAGAGLLATIGLPSKTKKAGGVFDDVDVPEIRTETPGAGGFDPRYDPRKLEQERLRNLQIGVTDTDTTPIPVVNLADYVDHPFITGMTDLTRGRSRLHSVNDTKLRHPLDLNTGEDFMHNRAMDPEAVWANTSGAATAIANEAGRLAEQTGKNTIFAPFRMAPSSADFSTNLTDLMGEYASLNVGSKTARMLDKQIEELIPGWPGILSPRSYEALHQAGGDKRKAVIQILDRDARNEGGLGIGEARLALAKPELVNPGTDMAVGNIGMITGGTTPIQNTAFPMGILGEPIGQLDRTHGVFELLPELAAQTRAKGATGPVDVKNPHANDAYTVRRGVRSGIFTDELLRYLGY